MKLRSGAIALLAIFLCLGFTQAVDGSGEDLDLEDDYLNYGNELFRGGSGSAETYSFTTSSSFTYYRYLQYFFTDEEFSPTDHGPVGFTITGNEPTILYFGWQTVPYSEYVSSAMYAGSNALWIEGETAWTRYAACPVGTWLQLIITTPAGGSAEFYEVSPASGTTITPYNLGTYDRMSFFAAEQGRYALFFVANNQPSNVVIIDVGEEWTPEMITGPDGTGQGAAPTTTIPDTTPAPTPTPTPTYGDVSVTLESQNMRGYDVYLDENYVGTDGQGGDALDGVYRINVVGGQWHTVKVWDGEWFYGKPRFFDRNTPVVLQFEPAATAYIYGGMW